MQKNDYLWKSFFEKIFDDFLRFMHPNADEIFNFKRKIKFLDQELEQLFPAESDDEISVKIVDKLAKLYTRDGKEEWVLIHCEVQDEYKSDFPLRMYTYYSRIFDKYGKRVSAYAILTGETKVTRTNCYTSEFLGIKLEYKYNIYQISQQNEAELQKSDNPFAMAVLTVLSVLKNKSLDDDALMKIKLELAKRFLTMSIPKEKIRALMNFLKIYIRFTDKENMTIFANNLKQITGRTEIMGLEELILDVECRRSENAA
jgi:hypothetical protein